MACGYRDNRKEEKEAKKGEREKTQEYWGFDVAYVRYARSHQRFPDGEVDMVALAEGEAHGEARIDAHRSAGANVEVAAAEVAGDCGGLFLSEVAGAFVGAERRRGGASEGAVVVIVLLVGEVGGAKGGVHRRRGELHGRRGGCCCER
jgi:hypothetical protein